MVKNNSIVLGGGCFWCFEALFSRVKGVVEVTSGYSGGDLQNPTYWDLHKPGNTHAEVVKIIFDPDQIDLETILQIFWTLHDPTTLNQQCADIGVEYRSIILYDSEEQKKVIEHSLKNVGQKLWQKPITTEIKSLETFWPAEEEQQKYFEKHPAQGYCTIVINPKVAKLKKNFAHLLKD